MTLLGLSILFAIAAAISGCAGAMGNMGSTDPVERGLSYVSAAIITSAVIRAFFNK